MALRTDELVVDFIDADAVRVASQTGKKPQILSMDQVLIEIEKDEFYCQKNEMKQDADAINHKEFITYNEFLSYFKDYRDIEDRNRDGSAVIKQKKEGRKKD